MDIGNRIKQRRVDLEISANELADMVGKSRATIYRYENGDIENLPTTVLEPLATALSTTPAYLMGWTDDPYNYDDYDLEIPDVFNGDVKRYFEFEKAIEQDVLEEQREFNSFLQTVLPSEIEHLEKYRALDPSGQFHVDAVLQWESVRAASLAEKDRRIAELESAPSTVIELSTRYGSRHLSEYFRDASAGGGIFILGNETASKIAIPDSEWDERTDYVIRVNGDSMMPDFKDGDNVMVSQRVELHHGDVGIFVVNGKAYIKEYGAEELVSRNPDSPNIPIHKYDNIVCMGKVIGKLDGEFEIIND